MPVFYSALLSLIDSMAASTGREDIVQADPGEMQSSRPNDMQPAPAMTDAEW